MKIRFFDPGKSYLKIKSEIDEAVQRVSARGDLILRKDIEQFEETLAKFIGTKYAVALSSGTAALYLSLKACGIGKGDEVIVKGHTFKATIGAIVDSGATPVIIDIFDSYFSHINNFTKAIILVHISGNTHSIETGLHHPNSFNYINKIEDCCQALGAWSMEYPKQKALKIKEKLTKAGSLGDIGCFSFYPAKILGAFGDAGAVTTDYKRVYEYIREARNHFKGTNKELGTNARMDNMQAAILNVKFKYLPEYLKRRQEIADMYYKGLKDLPLELPNKQEGRVYQDFIIKTEKRNYLYEYLKENEIETIKNEYPFSLEYPKPPLTAKYESETLRLPCNPDLEDEEIEYVIEKIKEYYGK